MMWFVWAWLAGTALAEPSHHTIDAWSQSVPMRDSRRVVMRGQVRDIGS